MTISLSIYWIVAIVVLTLALLSLIAYYRAKFRKFKREARFMTDEYQRAFVRSEEVESSYSKIHRHLNSLVTLYGSVLQRIPYLIQEAYPDWESDKVLRNHLETVSLFGSFIREIWARQSHGARFIDQDVDTFRSKMNSLPDVYKTDEINRKLYQKIEHLRFEQFIYLSSCYFENCSSSTCLDHEIERLFHKSGYSSNPKESH